ncbi:ImmA/IrrE family metallo-endopeptidase [Jatrophihabitans lederbergiae]|uniref:ImmA/IrrE family metallo-endopeptidase n=1 Tax=Jatrophihabitans lederbergiae TaxID=3075547 RepID=A0ABU2JHT7_9ACTN|nr:ImmA/IrrE family metallo-endopeptidase [Jatrophihabitans sp. DSM 44399]MDT0264336.1 ImmA/IrrE family metallo-endopeptidase [Jatrophihabitans sp. DSM 44399]
MSDPALVAKTADRLRTVAGFFAFELDRYRQLTHLDPASEFGIAAPSLSALGLCRLPRREHYAHDLTAISVRVRVPEEDLANFLRTADAVGALGSRGSAQASSPGSNGLMAAARDHALAYTEFEEIGANATTLPGWLGQGIDRFWGENAGPEQFPRDLQLPILINLPVAIIEIDDLTVANLDQWLQVHQLPTFAAVANRPLRGCLAAYAGVGILFVDRSDDHDQRRVTVAHEIGHFVLDYLLPREDVARRRPDLLAVLDGERAPTDAERFDALLADVPVGFHTHLLERDAHGGHLSSATAQVEDRAERLALELLAPMRSVMRETATAADSRAVLRERFGLPAGLATRYANHIARLRPQRPRSLLDAIGLAEPRDAEQSDVATVDDQETES